MNTTTLFAVFTAILVATALVTIGALHGIFTPLQMCIALVVGFSAAGATLHKLLFV